MSGSRFRIGQGNMRVALDNDLEYLREIDQVVSFAKAPSAQHVTDTAKANPSDGWDSTPRSLRGSEASGWSGARNHGWDAPTPRVARARTVDTREWAEE
ncbi:hypothetical protein HHX47_DHR8000220 [Lentinula edodes]|nr:hypothetical protein HHX47_DHR8000220 [Lentinula edodes]